jgi:hypothetical protein
MAGFSLTSFAPSRFLVRCYVSEQDRNWPLVVLIGI